MAAPIKPAGSADPDHSEDETDNLPAQAPFAWPRLARMDDPAPGKGLPSPLAGLGGGRSPVFVWIAAQACGLGLLLGGYLLGQAWSPHHPATRPEAAGRSALSTTPLRLATSQELGAVSQALKAERRHDFARARAIYGEASHGAAAVPGAEYRLALLALHEGDPAQATAHLNRSIQAGEAVADSYLFLASLVALDHDYAAVAARFAEAVRAAPYNARLLFCWGEALRRDGHPTEAVQHLTEALDRPDSSAARTLYLFKLLLARVEAGEAGGIGAELTRELARPSPAPEWLVLAAARDLLGSDDRAAAAHLEQARPGLPPDTFATWIQDYLFQDRRDRPGLSAILNVPPPAAPASEDAPLQDPAAWTPAEADPATWPPFATAP